MATQKARRKGTKAGRGGAKAGRGGAKAGRKRGSGAGSGGGNARPAAKNSPASLSVGALAAAMEAIAPNRLAESWDNTGLLVGDRAAPCTRVLLTIDLTDAVLDEALDLRVDAVVAYHPPIFEALKALRADAPRERVVLGAAQAGIAVLSPHTALDACRGGVNDWLAEGIAGGWREVERAKGYEPLRAAGHLPGSEAFKIVVFVPHAHATQVRDAMAQAGAGVIGRYDHCATMTPIVGSFRGLPGSRPTVGKAGRIEEVAEIRLELVCSKERVAWALAAMRAVHPYETPAFEVHGLAARPSLDEGQGRLIALRKPSSAKEIAARLQRHLGLRGAKAVEICEPYRNATTKHKRIGVCAGAGFSLAADAIARGATLFITGEARHHDKLSCVAQGCTLMLAGHTETERGYLPRLAERMATSVPGMQFACSKK